MTGAGRSNVRVKLVAMLFVISAIAFLDRTNISVAGVQMRQEYAIDQIRLGWVFSAFLIGYAAFQVPAGWLAARIGPRRLLTLALLWWGVFSVATAWVPRHRVVDHATGEAADCHRQERRHAEDRARLQIQPARLGEVDEEPAEEDPDDIAEREIAEKQPPYRAARQDRAPRDRTGCAPERCRL